ncbi:lipocalin-like domain-containing protein [Paraburkholderia sp. LEh10]|uniref:lipocalin-like domain-containing protein n=1 Tax=Paraburkholderia sp. LEh10 TaxID=2821353 RepID=UPI001AEA7411|nr:lipocalin-like domain-containing protein [Paraburkholderia sp. LEh10]MBP0593373.1 lipocalin-like domain-containing protein [Paraburkholderia sp. LEh10]
MRQISLLTGHTFAILLGMTISYTDVAAQTGTLKEQVVGTWAYVSVDTVQPDGSRQPMYGTNPQGLAVFDGSGHYILMTSRADIVKFASANRMEGTPEENKAVVQGMIAHFGTYTVNEADKIITFHVANSSFPNWNGAEQKRPFTISGDQLKWTTPASSGGTAEVVLRRLR